MFGGHADTREESTISTSLEAISAAERADGLPWVDLGVGRPFLSKGLHVCRSERVRSAFSGEGVAFSTPFLAKGLYF